MPDSSEQKDQTRAATEAPSQFLVTAPLPRLMLTYAMPCIISLLTGALYNIVDQIFIANARYLGSYGNAANTVVFPLTVVALAIAVMIGDGACAFISICLGRRKEGAAARTVGNAVSLCVMASILLTALYLARAEPVIKAFGGDVNEETFALSKEYFFWISIGLPFYMFGQGMNPVIRADGSPRFAMLSTLAGAALNIILDPLFIFGFRWGMRGAAIATVIGQVATATLALGYLCRTKLVRLSAKSFLPSGSIIRRFIPLGICSLLSQLSLVAAMAAINNMIRRYGALDPVFGREEFAQIPMAVVGIVMKFFQIVISVVVGMAAGCIPVAGYNRGAGRGDRAKQLFLLLLACEAAVGAAALIVVELFPGALIRIFGAANESIWYTSFAKRSFRIYLSMMVLACINKATFIYLQAIGKALLSTALSMIRELVFGVGLALLLPLRFGLDGVLYSMPLSDILTFIVSAGAIAFTLRQLDREG